MHIITIPNTLFCGIVQPPHMGMLLQLRQEIPLAEDGTPLVQIYTRHPLRFPSPATQKRREREVGLESGRTMFAHS